MAVGMVEVQGFSIALAVADVMLKTADITIEAFDANNPVTPEVKIPVIVQIKFRGGVSDVNAALEAGKREALNYLDESEVLTHCITMENKEMMPLFMSGKLPAPKKHTSKQAKEIEKEKKASKETKNG